MVKDKIMDWLEEEETYLRTTETACLRLSRAYHNEYFRKRKIYAQMKIPAIIIGSFTGVASFGTTTFPTSFHKWVAIMVGLVNIGIAVLNTLETFFKIGEDMNSARITSEHLKKLAEDINKELSLPVKDRPTNGITFLKDIYKRYQEITSSSPMLARYMSHAEPKDEHRDGFVKRVRQTLSRSATPAPSEAHMAEMDNMKLDNLQGEIISAESNIKGITTYLTKNKEKGSKKNERKTKVPIDTLEESTSPTEVIDIEKGIKNTDNKEIEDDTYHLPFPPSEPRL